MKLVLGLLVAVVAGCGGGGGDPLVGMWEYQDAAGTFGAGLRFDAGGTYRLELLWETTPTSANVQREDGTYTADGKTLVLTPSSWTCPGADPAATYQYNFAGGYLVVDMPAGVVTFAPLTGAPTATVSLAYGCNENGTWVPAQ